jgi:HD-GYP domain-containing protein (c-di-GMP phosphodiesterase class II)
VAVADVFQALAQARPYRPPMQPPEILSVLQQQVDCGKLDPQVVGCVRDNLQACWHAAMQVRPNREPQPQAA